MDETKKTVSSRHYAHVNSETVAGYTSPAQVQVSLSPNTERGKYTWAPTPNQEHICNPNLVAKRKSIFSSGVFRYINHTQGQMPCSELGGQQKMNMVFLWTLVLALFVLLVFCSFVLIFIICVFWGEIVAVFCACLFLFFLIERIWSWTGKGMRRIWEELEDGKIQKIFN